MYCLRLFIVVLKNYNYNIYYYYCDVFIETYVMCMQSFVLIGCCVSKLHGHLCPYRNVLPEAVYRCFTRTTYIVYKYAYSMVVTDI